MVIGSDRQILLIYDDDIVYVLVFRGESPFSWGIRLALPFRP